MSSPTQSYRPWPALWALVVGFFMILVDSTIVSVATPALMRGLSADITSVIWVTSAFLLAYAVPLLITGRLGDRFGPRRVYLTGLAVFTLASAWCGLTTSAGGLIAARVVQGLGASLMTPQTMAVITRLFPPHDRGRAMSLWGSVAGVATLVGPILGGLLVDSLGWSWIFFVNLPVGLVGFVLAWRLVPEFDTRRHRFDWLGVVLNAVGLACLVFGIQEGRTYHWGTITGPISVWSLIIAGVVILAGFVAWQALNRAEPLLPLSLFADRNFSLANAGIAVVGFTITAMPFPIMIWAQAARGLSPTQSALLLAPSAIITTVLAPRMGLVVDRRHPRVLAGAGLSCFAIALFWLSRLIVSDAALVWTLLPVCLLGIANSLMWAPLATTATANLPVHRAGAGAGVYNTTRQIGAVIGSAAIAAMMDSRVAAHLPGATGLPSGSMGSASIPEPVRLGLAQAMGESLLLPAAVIAAGVLIAAALARPQYQQI